MIRREARELIGRIDAIGIVDEDEGAKLLRIELTEQGCVGCGRRSTMSVSEERISDAIAEEFRELLARAKRSTRSRG